MNTANSIAVVTGGGSGLGRAAAARLLSGGFRVLIIDQSAESAESAVSALGAGVDFRTGDVCDENAMHAAFGAAEEMGTLRAVVHCAGRGGPLRVLDREGRAGSLCDFEGIVRTNLIGSFNVMRLAAEVMARNDPVNNERGVIVLTASIAAFEGQIGQIAYASSKAGVVGMTLVGARDLASKLIRVCTIAPGLFDTPMLARVPNHVREALSASVPNPSRLGNPEEFAMLAEHIIANPMLNGETIRLDGALRMQAK